jgi:hypothetical protein
LVQTELKKVSAHSGCRCSASSAMKFCFTACHSASRSTSLSDARSNSRSIRCTASSTRMS